MLYFFVMLDLNSCPVVRQDKDKTSQDKTTGKTNFIFTFKDTTPCKRLTLIGSSTCWGPSSYFLVPSYCSITLFRLNNPLLWMISFTVLRPKDCLYLALEWAATGILLNLCFILVWCFMFKW